MSDQITHDEQDRIRALLLGRTVTKVGDDTLSLDDGTSLRIVPNEGCGGCPSGNYALTELNDCPVNAIMAVEFDYGDHGDNDFEPTQFYRVFVNDFEPTQFYRVFVLAQDARIKLVDVEGNDGNGYYGTGYWVEVTR